MKIYESHLNFLGKIPVIQQISGTGRVIYGICKVVKNFTGQYVSNLEEYERGKSYIGRGFIEIIPIISTFALGLFDLLAQYQIDMKIKEPTDIQPNEPNKNFKFNIELWKNFPSQRHLFTILEDGLFFQSVNKETNPRYGEQYLIKRFGCIRLVSSS